MADRGSCRWEEECDDGAEVGDEADSDALRCSCSSDEWLTGMAAAGEADAVL